MKKLLYILPMVTVLMLPLTINAQGDDFFRNWKDNNYENRDGKLNIYFGGSGGMGVVDPGASVMEDPTVPIGNGLLIMIMAGAGYALLKKKEEAK